MQTMNICIKISQNDAGEMSVGVCPTDEKLEKAGEYMESVPNIDSLLGKVRELLSKSEEESVEADESKPKTMVGAMFPEKGKKA